MTPPEHTQPERRPESSRDAGAGVDSATVDGRIKPIVADIRGRLADLTARESAVQLREHGLEGRYQQLHLEARSAAEREWAEAQERSTRRSGELDAQAVELTARRARLEVLDQRLSERQLAQERAEQQLREQVQALRTRSASFTQLREEERQRLRQRIAKIREREQQLTQRITQAHRDILAQRRALDDERAARRTQAEELERAELELQAQRTELERALAELQARVSQIDQEQNTLGSAQTDLKSRRADLSQTVSSLERVRRELETKQRALDERWRSTRSERTQLARQQEALDAQRRLLQEQGAALQQRLRRVENYDQQLRGRAASLETQERRLAEADAALQERRAGADQVFQQAEESLRQSQRRQEEVLALREQVDALQAENRQRQLALELEREAVGQERTALTVAQEHLDAQRRQHEAELEQIRAALQAQAQELRRVEQSRWRGPRRWWLRAAGVAAAAGLVAGLGWWAVERPTYRAVCELRLLGDVARPAETLREHEHRLRAPTAIADAVADRHHAAAWEAALADGRVRSAVATEPPALHVAVDGRERDFARALLEQVCIGYCELARRAPHTLLAPEAGARLAQQRSEYAQRLEERRQERQSYATRLGVLPTAAQRDQLRATVGQLRTEYEELGRTLAEQRGRLSTQRAASPPRGTVSTAEHETTLATEEMYAEDAKEFRAAALQYRSELAVAMLLLVDPSKDVQRVQVAFSDTVAEQRRLQPPLAVAAVLEQIAGELATLRERLATFVPQWESWLDEIQRLVPEEQVIELVRRQQAVAQAAQQFSAGADGTQAAIRKQLDALAGGTDGGTRAVVVAAVVRDELGKLGTALAALAKAAEQIDVASNFRLDALDRQLRGLRTRLERRSAAVRQQLQFEADERARREYVEQVAALERTVSAAEQRREQLVGGLTDQLDALRHADQQVVQRAELEASARRCDADLVELQEKIAVADEQLAAVRGQGVGATLEAGSVQIETVAGRHRYRNAGLAGLAVASAVYLLCVLMVVKNPLRRPEPWEQRLSALPASAAGTPQQPEPVAVPAAGDGDMPRPPDGTARPGVGA